MSLRTIRRAAVLALGGMVLIAVPASAHPFVRGGEAPVDSLATITLAMAHGCASETDGEGDPTTDVSLEVPEWMRVIDVPEEEGWRVDLEESDEGALEVVTWTADGAVEPAPDFDLEVVVSGEVGETRYLRVFQACDEFVYRWVGTPDDPADDPAIRLTLAAADPDAPPPPPDREGPTGDEPDAEAPVGEEPDGEESEQPDVEPVEPDPEPVEPDPDGDPLAAEGDDAAVPGWLLPVTVVVLLGGLGLLLFGRRGRGDA